MEGIPSIKEESPLGSSRVMQQPAVGDVNPTPGLGPETLSTESTDSVKTLRGEQVLMSPGPLATPSYPFPTMGNLASGTPLETPGAHKPFTSLSPTVTPSPAKLAKHKISQDFRSAGHVSSQQNEPAFKSKAASFDGLSSPKPNLMNIVINVQSELGLLGWWEQVTKALAHGFGAERAMLAVATDATDVENVPWAQLATYYDHQDDEMSKATNDRESSKSSLASVASRDQQSVKSTGKGSNSNLRSLAFASSGLNPMSNRPKLESRNTYAGVPSKQMPLSADDPANILVAAGKPSSPNRGNSFQSSLAGTSFFEGDELNADSLQRFEAEELARAFAKGDCPQHKLSGSRILQPVQPLESEADPLITSAGVVKVLHRGVATVLTREYHDSSEGDLAQSNKQSSSHSNFPAKLETSVKVAPSSSSKIQQIPRSTTGVKSSKASKRQLSESSKTSSQGSLQEAQLKTKLSSSPNAYEDFEQYPGTPWAQSPAPSPAPQADPQENPFFSSLPDQGAFDDNLPEAQYDVPSQIQAIGLDRSRSIIQIPLIHPNASLSQSQRVHFTREDSQRKGRGQRGEKKENEEDRKASQASSEIHGFRPIPIAVLSVLAPTVPYPPNLVDSLNELAPALATSFYAARAHTKMLTELSALLSRRRPSSMGPLRLRDEQSLSDVAGATGMSFVESLRERPGMSPTSPSSTASTSTESTMNMHSPKGSHGGGSFSIATQGWESKEPMSRGVQQGLAVKNAEARSPGARSPGLESREGREDYFQSTQPRQQRTKEDQPPNSKTPARPPLGKRNVSGSKKQVLHSQGASFANTQPSLPSATSTYAAPVGESEQVQTEDLDMPHEVAHVFKEPSSSILRTMIDNGATQQFIAESETGSLMWANSKFLAYRNTSKDNIQEQLWKNIYHKDVARFRTVWNKSLETGEQLSHQVRLKRFDGQFRWFHIRFLPLKDKHGLTKYWHGQAMDIHDLHEAEVKAAKSKEKALSESKYRAIANSLPVIVFAASVPTGMTFANTQWLSYSGQGLDEALGFGFLDHVHPEDLVKCRFPGFDPQTSTAILRPKINPSLTRSTSNVSSTADSEDTNSTEKTLKAPPNTSSSDSWEHMIPNHLLRGLAKDGIIMCAKDEQGNLSITTEMRLKSRKGEYRWHLVQGSFIESVDFGQGEAQWFIACTDISNQKQNEAKIQDANVALETTNITLENEMRRKMGYLSSMSHEIRTPLNGIIGNLQFLINSGLNDTASEWAHGAQDAAKNMHDLINDILDLSKAEANMLKLSSHWFNPRGLMEQVMDMLNSKASEKKIEIVNECAENVPKIVKGDSGRIRQVLLNLAGNAIKFTTQGEVVIVCSLFEGTPSDSGISELGDNEILIRWAVIDTGTGFSEQDKKLLFKPYSQIKNKNTRNEGGTGLGLILCKTMVTLHGGAIDATSRPGRGSVFSFFARFKTRRDSATYSTHSSSMRSGMVSPAEAPPHLSPVLGVHFTESPLRKPNVPLDIARESPALASDSSSAHSISSTGFHTSLRSSTSTTDSRVPLNLTLPSPGNGPNAAPESKQEKPRQRSTVSGALPSKFLPKVRSPTTATPLVTRTSPTLSPKGEVPMVTKDVATDSERAKFRPPMLSVLVVCPAEQTRRITCAQIKYVAPRSTPCNITSEGSLDVADNLLYGGDPVTFTHVVFRITSDEMVERSVKNLLASTKHPQTCIVVLTDQAQVKFLSKNAPKLNFDELSKNDRVKLLLKPAHLYKLAKVFDPFNENALITEDPKEAKRKEEKRLMKESYALFKNVLGNKGVRVLAVEDDKLQMNILHNFLAKICFLEVTQAWNGQEALDLYKAHEPGYYSVIVTDIEMPVLDGLSMCRRIREWEAQKLWPPVNVISLSANTFYQGWTQSAEAGFTHYSGKPVNFRDLGNVILELTDPNIPHKFLKDREMPRATLKKLGLLPPTEDDSDDEEIEY